MAGASRKARSDRRRTRGAEDALDVVVGRLRAALVEDGQLPPEPKVEAEAARPPAEVVPLRSPGDAPPPRPAGDRRRRFTRWTFPRFVLGSVLGLSLAAALFYAVVPEFADPPLPRRPERLAYVTADGVTLGMTRTVDPAAEGGSKLAFGTRAEWSPVTLDALPAHVERAVLAREDHRFRRHWGVRPESLLASLWACVRERACSRGGSTIHMQVVRGGVRHRRATLLDKTREIPLAFWAARRWSRDQVLERYLNDVYWGDELHGINAAAWRYLRKRPSQLTLAESALLVGMLSAPNRTDPYDNPVRARRERNRVLDAMLKRGWLAPADAARARRTPLPRRRPLPSPQTTQSRAYVRWAAAQAEAGPRSDAVTAALALDTRTQAAAYAAVKRRLTGRPDLQAGVVVMAADGRVLALVGGRSEAEDTGRAAVARRSPASTAKVFTFVEALKRGMELDDEISGSPVSVGDYAPRNYDDRIYGDVTLAEAWAGSINTAAVRLNEGLWPWRVVRLARSVGVDIPGKAGPAAPLGAYEVSLLQQTAAYAAFVGNCGRVAPSALAVRSGAPCRPLLDAVAHRRFLALMRSGVAAGATGAAAGRGGLDVGGKTGTSEESRDALFVGYVTVASGPVLIGVWVGRDQGKPTIPVTGGGAPALIFNDVARTLARGA